MILTHTLLVSFVKVVKDCKILTFKVNFLGRKLFELLLNFHWRNHFRSKFFVIYIFWQLQFLNHFFSKMKSNFWQLLLNSSAGKQKARRVNWGNLGFSFVKLEAIIELKLEFYSSIHFNCSELLRVPAKLYPIKAAVTHQPVLFSFSSSLLWLLGWWRSDPRLPQFVGMADKSSIISSLQ